MSFDVFPVYDEDGKTVVGYKICEGDYCIPCDSEEAAILLADEMNKGEGDGDGGMKM